MAERTLRQVIGEFRKTLTESRAFALDANRWYLPGASPRISRKRRDSIIELVFLRGFLAWETFLEESFVLYLVGKTAPRGRAPHRYTLPPTRRFAEAWVVPEGRHYAGWDAQHVSSRAERFFRDGRPYSAVLRANQNLLQETRTIRNAIAHESSSAKDKFETAVRIRLGALPPNLTVGGFLGMTVVSSSPPQSYLEFYLQRLDFVADRIVPGV